MDIGCQGTLVADVFDMGFLIQYRLIEVGNAPTMGNVKLEQFSEGRGSLRGRGVSPCAKRNEQISVLIECHMAVHHGAETDGTNRLQRSVVFLENLLAKLPITFLPISTALMRVEPNSMPRTVRAPLIASWVSLRFMFISQNLRSFLQTWISG